MHSHKDTALMHQAGSADRTLSGRSLNGQIISSGRSVVRSSRLVWDQEVASSNLAAPTSFTKRFTNLGL